jgi:sigma-B regulation protein RsbU (phosphoserine phosphatase)
VRRVPVSDVIELGTIRCGTDGSVREARRKIRRAVEALSDEGMLGGRIASATSQLLRVVNQMSGDARLDLGLDVDRDRPEFVLAFIGTDVRLEDDIPPAFFDTVRRVTIDGKSVLQLRLELRSVRDGALAEPRLRALRAMIEKKDRDALMRELTVKNQELQESFDNLRRTTTAKERMESELNIGRDIQMSMLPLEFPPYPHRNEFTVFATLEPAREVGGDFYDFFLVDEDRFCFCVGDVSGKGVPAALFMAVTKTLIKSRATNDFSPASIITHVNDEIADGNDSAMFVTLWLGILDVSSGRLVYTNAGHNPPYLRRASGELVRLDRLHGPVIGALEGLVYGEDEEALARSDHLFLYTDGVTEAMDPQGVLYEEDRLVEVLNSGEFDSVESLVAASTEDVWRFQAEAEQADDVTVLAVRFEGRARGASDVHVLELEARNTFEEIDTVNEAFETFAETHGLHSKVRRSLKLVFDDLLNNVISYAYNDDEEHVIEIHIELSSDRIAVRISDDGHPFNPFGRGTPEKGSDVASREIGGLGIHLVESLMDEVSYTRRTNQNVVVLVKYLSQNTMEKESA